MEFGGRVCFPTFASLADSLMNLMFDRIVRGESAEEVQTVLKGMAGIESLKGFRKAVLCHACT